MSTPNHQISSLSKPADTSVSYVTRRLWATVIGLAGIGLILYLDDRVQHVRGLPSLSQDISYGLLFAVGLLTGFHCVGMCGALVLSYTTKLVGAGRPSYSAHLLYGTGKTLSYTVLGAGFGWLGSILAFTPLLRGGIGIAAGIFLVLFGLGMLNVLPAMRGFGVRMPRFLLRFIGTQSRKSGHPFVIGLLNGLMIICGPLQAMYIMAAGSGSVWRGASMLLVFGVGTLPMMMGLGVFATMVSREFTPKLIKASAIIVMALGAVMANRGLKMVESGLDFESLRYRVLQSVSATWNDWQHQAELNGIELPKLPVPAAPPVKAAVTPREIRTEVTKEGITPNEFRLRLNEPVRWTIEAQAIADDDGRIVIPEWGLDLPLHPGVQTVQFTPLRAEIVNWRSSSGATLIRFLVEDPRVDMMHHH